MVNTYNIWIKLQAKFLQNDLSVKRKELQLSSGRHLSADGASTGTTGGEADFDSNI
jgi:hypothetical protein